MTASTVLLGPSLTPPPSPTPPAGTKLPGPSQWLTDTVTAAVAWCTHRPWLAGVAAAILIASQVARAVLARWRHRMMARHANLVTITPPPEVDPAGTAAFWATLAEILSTGWRRRLRDGRAHIAVEYRWTGRQLTIAVWVPGTLQTGPIQAAVRGAWPGAACTVTDAAPPLPLDAVTVGGALAPTLPPWYPLETDHDNDPMRTLIAAASNLHSAESACVQLLARPASTRQIRRLRHGVQALRTGKPPRALLDPATWLRVALDAGLELFGPTRRTALHNANRPAPLPSGDPQRERDGRAGIDKLAGPQWEVGIRYAVAHTNPRSSKPADLQPRLATLAHGVASAFGVWTGRNRLRRLKLAHPAASGRAHHPDHPSATSRSTCGTRSTRSAASNQRRCPTWTPACSPPNRRPRWSAPSWSTCGRLVLIDPDQPEGTTLNPLAGDDHDLVVDNVVSIFGKIFGNRSPSPDNSLRGTLYRGTGPWSCCVRPTRLVPTPSLTH
ncbi:MAG TPA: hypothetical protein VFM55_09340 [Micromonosporaceae bacterium]|nr:hypothetical protein [Micromonosporaceae bacterium]